MDVDLERLVRDRAGGACEYRKLPEALCFFSFEIDHIIALKHGGQTSAENLALACYYNSAKGPNIAGIDPESGVIVRLFHPRRDRWHRHFRWQGGQLVGRTSIGRATIVVLEINHPEAIAFRESLANEGRFPSA